jgi:hypothetical protein
VSSTASSANFVVWNRLFCSSSAAVRNDGEFETLLKGWKDALIPTFAQDRLRVRVEYQPLDGTAVRRFDFSVEP